MTDPVPWQQLLDEAPVAISIVDPTGHQVACNREYALLLGYTLDEAQSLDVAAITRPDDQQWTRSYLDQLGSGQLERYVTDKVYVRKDGSTFTGRLTSRALRDEDGVCTHLIGTIVPVESRPKIGVAQVRRMFDFTDDTLTLVDRDGVVRETSGRYAPVLGYPAEFWDTRTVFDLIGPDDVERAVRLREELVSAPGGEIETEIVVRAADGDEHILHVRGFNALDDPELHALVIVSRNVTEHRRAVAELALAKARAEADVDSQTRLLATVSHELRNPLHAAHGLTDLLAADQLPPQADDLVRTLRRQLKSLTQVTDDLLDAARLDGGQVVMQPVPTALSEVVGDVVRLARASATRLGKEAVLDVSGRTVQGTPVWVLADTDRLRQVLSNLVGNAVKFTANGSVQLVVRADGPDVVFSVIDTGVGIPADEHEAVLKPFGIGSTAGDQRGAGLGLAVVQRIVGAMDGSLAITSAPGAGTRFDVRIPLPATDAPAAATGVALTAGLAVLVVEDNPVNQQLAQRQLDRLGLVPVIVGSGEEAIELLAEHVATEPDVAPFAVILMDQQLPGMTGTQTTQRIRQLGGAVAATPVIGVSASASSADRDAFTDAGMDAFIAKPASLGDLSAVIGEVLGRSAGAPAGAGPAASASQGPVFEGPVFEGPVFEGPVFEDQVLATLAEELGSSQIAASIVQTYLGELDARVASIIAPAEHGLADGRPVAHMLKSSSRLVGALPLGDVAHRIEQTGTVDADGLRSLAARTKEALAGWVARVGG